MRRIRCSIRLCGLVIVILASSLVQILAFQREHHLDYRTQRLEDSDPLGLLGIRVPSSRTNADGTSSGADQLDYRLPLTLRIRSVTSSKIETRIRLNLEVILFNAGSSALSIPISVDPGKAPMLPPNKGRRRIELSLNLKASATGEELQTTALVMDGSQTAAASLLRLEPSDSVVVLFQLELGPSQKMRDAPEIDVRAIIQEQLIEDNSYVIERRSDEIRSENVIKTSFPR